MFGSLHGFHEGEVGTYGEIQRLQLTA